jgi:hypothetical protein
MSQNVTSCSACLRWFSQPDPTSSSRRGQPNSADYISYGTSVISDEGKFAPACREMLAGGLLPATPVHSFDEHPTLKHPEQVAWVIRIGKDIDLLKELGAFDFRVNISKG